MRIDLYHPTGRDISIESENPELIVLWLAEHATTSNGDWRARIWFTTNTEAKAFGVPYMHHKEWTETGLRQMEKIFRDARLRLYPPKEKAKK